MARAELTQALLELGDQLAELLGDEWPAAEPRLTLLFDQLRRAGTDAEREAAANAVIVAVSEFEVAHPALRRALRAGTGGRGRRGRESVPEQSAEPESANGDEPATLQRWPHIDLDQPEPVPVSGGLVVTVYIDADAQRTGETSTAVTLPVNKDVRLRVLLVTSHHFTLDGDDAGWITLPAGADRSSTAEFKLTVVDGAAGAGVITAVLFHDGRPAGSVHREVTVGAPTAVAATEDVPEPAVRVDLTAKRTDLTVTIAPIPGTGGQRYSCTVSTSHLSAYADGVSEDWDIPDQASTKTFVMGRMAGFTRGRIPAEARRAELISAGLSLFEASPPNFQRVYWELRDRGLPLETIFVVSSEPYVPWELMIPVRGGVDDALPIGVTSSVGRWVDPQHVSPRQPRPLGDSYVIAPTYTGSKRLNFAADEARFVCDEFAGRQISPAMYATIEATMGQRGAALLHLVCHGTDQDSGQAIDLDPDEILTDSMLRGMTKLKAAVRTAGPLVFINACQVGRQTPALVGTGGFAAAFIAIGAQAVIAPIWSVRDEVAATVARDFYTEVKKHPELPFARILRDIRRRAYEGGDHEDSWAAYCFYGDPLTGAG